MSTFLKLLVDYTQSKTLISLFPPSCFTYGMNTVVWMALTKSDLALLSGTDWEQFSLIQALGLMIFDLVLWSVLFIYFDQVSQSVSQKEGGKEGERGKGEGGGK